jgi:radical SAM protein with 4Fe4S-binding SPASM domain
MWSKIAVRADGVIVPCNMLSQIELGRINKDNLVEIWQNHSELKRLRDRRTIPLSTFEFCRECQWLPYCTGNCPGSGYAVTGDAYKPSHQGCMRRFMESGGELVPPIS